MNYNLHIPCTFKEATHREDGTYPKVFAGVMNPLKPINEFNLSDIWSYTYYKDISKIALYQSLRCDSKVKHYLFYDEKNMALVLSEKEYNFEIEIDEDVSSQVITGRFKLKVGEDKYLAIKEDFTKNES